MEQIANLLGSFTQVPPQVWVFILGAIGVSALTEIVKNVTKLENEKVVQVVLNSISFLAVAGQSLIENHAMPPELLGLSTAGIVGIATPAYFFVIKPISMWIVRIKALIDAGSQLNASATPAQAAPSVAPAERITPQPQLSQTTGTETPPSNEATF